MTFAETLRLVPVVGPWLGIAALIALLLRAWQPFREMALQRDDKEAARLAARVDTLEALVERLHTKIDRERAEYDAMMSIMRHRVNNSRMALKSIIMMLRVNPQKVSEALDQIEAMMAEQEAAEREEKAALDRARMTLADMDKGAGE